MNSSIEYQFDNIIDCHNQPEWREIEWIGHTLSQETRTNNTPLQGIKSGGLKLFGEVRFLVLTLEA